MPAVAKAMADNGPVAQLDRVPDYGSGGWGFDSSLVHLARRSISKGGLFI